MAELQLPASRPPEGQGDGSSGRLPKPPKRELRRHLRFRIDDASAQVSLKGFLTSFGLGKVHKARAAINLSEGGVLLLTREPIPEGTPVTVRIEMERYSDFIEAAGVVKWCEQGAHREEEYYAGIEFRGLAPGDLKKIAQMREWFNSPEYKARRATRRRTQPPTIETNS
ncbi:MAG TPA: PilZ domain-containing protein [Planctomycetota bacterium]|nr:PilZ domain-containing protein [Planctomycetota bacterium]